MGVKLLSVMYLGRRHVNLRQTKDELTVMTPADLAGVNLRMPGTDAWQFLGKALGANPTPMAFTEVYTALQTGSVDGQDNPLPTVVDAKFYEVTKQIALTSHLVDLNYIAFSKAVWDELTPEQQATVQAAAEAAAESGRQKQLQKGSGSGVVPERAGTGGLRARSEGVPRACSGGICRLASSPRAGPRACWTRSTRSATDRTDIDTRKDGSNRPSFDSVSYRMTRPGMHR